MTIEAIIGALALAVAIFISLVFLSMRRNRNDSRRNVPDSFSERLKFFLTYIQEIYETEPLSDEDRLRNREAILKIGIAAVFAVCIVIWFHQIQYVQPHNYIELPKPNNPARNLTAIINAYSFTFGAQSYVEIFVTIHPDPQSLSEYLALNKTFTSGVGSGLPQRYIVGFEGTNCSPIPREEQEKYFPTFVCGLELPFVDSEGVYKNHRKVVYAVEGEYGIYLGETVPSIRMIQYSDYKIVKIAPLENTLDDVYSRVYSTLTVIGVYLGIVAIHVQSRRM